jgi:hypothetical protein
LHQPPRDRFKSVTKTEEAKNTYSDNRDIANDRTELQNFWAQLGLKNAKALLGIEDIN